MTGTTSRRSSPPCPRWGGSTGPTTCRTASRPREEAFLQPRQPPPGQVEQPQLDGNTFVELHGHRRQVAGGGEAICDKCTPFIPLPLLHEFSSHPHRAPVTDEVNDKPPRPVVTRRPAHDGVDLLLRHPL